MMRSRHDEPVMTCVSVKDYANKRSFKGALLLVFVAGLLSSASRAQYGGGTGEPNDPYLIYTADHFYYMGVAAEDWDRHFRLMADIDLGSSTRTNFGKIGTDRSPFRGTFDGNGHTISNLTYILLSGAKEDNVGLFGYVCNLLPQPTIQNLGLIDPNIDAVSRGAGNNVGSLIGNLFSGTIVNCYACGGYVKGATAVGGLVGGYAPTSMMVTRSLTSCYATTRVSGTAAVGGLIGLCEVTTISHCYATGNVSGQKEVGGLAGRNFGGTLETCYSTGKVLGLGQTGGLVGYNHLGEILNCFSISRVIGDSVVGGLVGTNDGTVLCCHSAGGVEGTMDVGGLVGSCSGGIFYIDGSPVIGVASDSFWDVDMSGQATSAGGEGRNTCEMRQRATFVNWDFNDVWDIAEHQTYPFLRRFAAGDDETDGDVE